jgi:hypothetical protein
MLGGMIDMRRELTGAKNSFSVPIFPAVHNISNQTDVNQNSITHLALYI